MNLYKYIAHIENLIHSEEAIYLYDSKFFIGYATITDYRFKFILKYINLTF